MLMTAAAPAIANAGWQTYTETSKIDDSTNVIIAVEANELAENRFGRPATIRAIAQCIDGKTGFFINFDSFYMSDFNGRGIVTMRVDKEKARRINMGESTDHRSLGLTGGAAIRLLKTMQGKSSFVVAAIPVNESEVQVTFTLAGFDGAIKSVRSACGW